MGVDSSNTHSAPGEESNSPSGALRVIVADDDVLLREGLSSLLGRSGFDVVGQTGNATETLALVRAENPDLLVVDIRMPPTNTTEGLDVAGVIRGELPEIGILVLSAHVDVEQRWSSCPAVMPSVISSRVG